MVFGEIERNLLIYSRSTWMRKMKKNEPLLDEQLGEDERAMTSP